MLLNLRAPDGNYGWSDFGVAWIATLFGMLWPTALLLGAASFVLAAISALRVKEHRT